MRHKALCYAAQGTLLCGTGQFVMQLTLRVASYPDAATHVLHGSRSKTQTICGCEVLKMYFKCNAYKGILKWRLSVSNAKFHAKVHTVQASIQYFHDNPS